MKSRDAGETGVDDPADVLRAIAEEIVREAFRGLRESAAPSTPSSSPASEPSPSAGSAKAQSAAAKAADEARRRPDHIPGFQIDCGAKRSVPHVGIVFVHGIGNQAAGATLLDWSSKIIALLIDARSIQDTKGDPVISVQLDPGPSGSRYIELRLPEGKRQDGPGVVPEQHWVMTEAWWAERVRPPAFGDMAEWLGPRGAIRRIVTAMLPRRSGGHDPRRRPAVETQPLVFGTEPVHPFLGRTRRWWASFRNWAPGDAPADDVKRVVKERGDVGAVYRDVKGPQNRVVELLKGALSDLGTLVLSIGAGAYFQAISALLLVLYGALRSVEKIVPIGPLKNGALTRPIDSFILDWFGDVYVLLREPAQAASVRGRLIDAIRDLMANDCKPIVVVAHSGGAIVSYMTLADEEQDDLQVDRLITLGEGLNLAWRLTAGNDGVASKDTKRLYDRLYSDMLAIRKDLQWDDFWGSQDPAPVGVLQPEPDLMSEASLGRIQSHSIWNRLAFREDHGSYWDNDEEFLIPLARLIDRNPPDQRMFSDQSRDRAQSIRRRRRLTMLSIWRQLALVAPTAAIVMSYAMGRTFIADTGAAIANAWQQVPGHEAITVPLDAIRKLNLREADFWRPWSEAGVWVVVAVLGLLTLTSLVAPSERPVPWNNRDQPWYRPFNLFAGFLRILPFVVAIPVVVSVGAAGLTFLGGATDIGLQIGMFLLRLLVATIVFAGVAYLLFASPWTDWKILRWPRDLLELAATITVMVVTGFLAIAPILAILVFPEVGTMVLGFATIIIAFQIVGRIGNWRWVVWDGRERVSARTRKPYPSLFRIVAQMTVLIGAILLGWVGVVTASTNVLLWAAGLAGVAVLLGVAVDVMDVARGKRREPGDALARGQNTL